ncbi:hypothetical protein Mevan_1558 [Methanococcus vannielii SB]|uniref:Uncharacterized protein n=1 Tax=Methanococcus vannielii (strain ATCC 35089 / DSM 1224 / JCM 13029 / OCM 148 / SB) TaxID=406327 RepID=A6USH8_METVS|nr:hypothetical protein [Methanococcus vannielii]ABR55450.1 hypothetical protein Mevan_1558 [Methanococcus vannielii SB]
MKLNLILVVFLIITTLGYILEYIDVIEPDSKNITPGWYLLRSELDTPDNRYFKSFYIVKNNPLTLGSSKNYFDNSTSYTVDYTSLDSHLSENITLSSWRILDDKKSSKWCSIKFYVGCSS